MEHSGHSTHGGPATQDRPSVHGMVVIGSDAIFLSHLAMFHSPHDYQVLLEATFGAANSVYRDDRNAHPNVRFYTFAPEKFALPELFPGPSGEPARRTSFTGSLVRNHFERPPAHPDPPTEIATDVTVEVLRVLHHRKFDPQDAGLEHLTYLLFGKGTELFLAHRITRSPDHSPAFDQLLKIELSGTTITSEMLRRAVEITIPGRPNTHGNRITEGQQVTGRAHIEGQDVQVEIGARLELYVETNDFT
jgi:hypothetical protein